MTIDFSKLERSVLDTERLKRELFAAKILRDENIQQILQQLKKGESTGVPFLDSSIFSSHSPFKKQKQLEEAAGLLTRSAGEYALIIEHDSYSVRMTGFPECRYRNFPYKKAIIGILDNDALREKKIQDPDFSTKIGYVITVNFKDNRYISLSQPRIWDGEREDVIELVENSNAPNDRHRTSPYWRTTAREFNVAILTDNENGRYLLSGGEDGKPNFEIYAGNQALLKCVAHLGIAKPIPLCELYETIKSKGQSSPIFSGPDYVRKLEKLELALEK